MVQMVTSDGQFDQLMQSSRDKLVVVDFFAHWCGPCRMLEPVFVALASKYPAAVFLKVDVDQANETARACGVHAMPTIQLYAKGSKVGEVVGADPHAIERLIAAHYNVFSAFTGSGRKLADTPPPAVAPTAPAAAAASGSAATDGLGETGDCEVQVRLPGGDVVRGRFSSGDALQRVKEWVARQPGVGGGFKLMLPGFPRRVYEDAELANTLEQEKLTPRAQLFVCK